jgi:hypothetical protein
MSKSESSTPSAARNLTKLAPLYVETMGGALLPLKGKQPIHKKWTEARYSTSSVGAKCAAEGLNVGWRIPDGVAVVDIDPRNGATPDVIDAFDMEHGTDLLANPRRVKTGSGGYHVFYAVPLGTRFVNSLKAFPGLEYKGVGRQVVTAGSIHPDTGQPYVIEGDFSAPMLDLPELALRAIQRSNGPAVATSGGELTAEQADHVLKHLDPCNFGTNEKWEPLMMAVHHATAGDAREEWIDWSTSDPKFADAAEEIGRRWDSLHAKKDGPVVGIGTLRRVLAEADALDVLPPDQDAARADFADADDPDLDLSEEEPSPLEGWQWIADSMQYISDDGLRRWNDRQFKMLNGHICPEKDLITQLERGHVPIKKYNRQVYIPNAEAVVQHQGEAAFNIWRPSAMTPKPGDHQWFLDHVGYLFPDKASQQHLLDFMAQLIQHPDVKINFALLLQSSQGVGKGALAMILRKIIGKRNCVEPSNDEVTKQWTGWLEGAQLAIINELMAQGRADVLNRLKSPITEDTLRIEKKFGNAFAIPNYMNFFGMTNFKDALPIDEDDRRWLILFSRAKKREPEYYDALFRNIADDDKVAAVMHYLLQHQISFNPKAPAPFTDAKREMGERARSDVEAELQMLYDQERSPFNGPLLQLESIVSAIKERHPHERKMHATSSRFLDRIGAEKLRRYKKGAEGLPAYQLYAIRDHVKWKAMQPVSVMRCYMAQEPDDGDDFG